MPPLRTFTFRKGSIYTLMIQATDQIEALSFLLEFVEHDAHAWTCDELGGRNVGEFMDNMRALLVGPT